MFPVLLSVGKVTISSYGVFLALGFLIGIFLVWRLSRAWDLDEEKSLDLTLLTFVGGLLGARIYYVLEHLQFFVHSPINAVLINKVPGFSFWGGILGGWLSLFYLAKRFRMDFWHLADMAAVGLLGGLILSDIGCFFGGCSIGAPSRAFFAVTMVGAVGTRWPIQILEALLLTFTLSAIWEQATHFHQRGKIVSLAFIYVGIVKLLTDPLKQDHAESIYAVICILLGINIYYKVTKQNPIMHLKQFRKFLVGIVISSQYRKEVIQRINKSCYNQKTLLIWRLRNLKKLLKKPNAKLS